MENHVKYAEQIYAEGVDGSLYVNLFIPSVLNWKSKQVRVEQNTTYPASDKASFIIHTKAVKKFAIKIRKPSWAKDVGVTVNDKEIKLIINEEGFIVVDKLWKEGDKIVVTMPMSIYTESIADNENRLAFLYGPLVLAGKLPRENSTDGVPVLVAEKSQLSSSIQKENNGMIFTTAALSQPAPVTLVPFYSINDEKQMVYFDLYNKEQWRQYKAILEEEKKKAAEIEKRTTDVLRIGEMQPERDHNLLGEKTFSGEMGEYKWRDARDGGWFSFEMQLGTEPAEYLLQCTYWGSDGGGREFDILVKGEKIAGEVLIAANPNKFIKKEYKIPAAITAGKKVITVKLQALPGKTAGGLFGCRVMKTTD